MIDQFITLLAVSIIRAIKAFFSVPVIEEKHPQKILSDDQGEDYITDKLATIFSAKYVEEDRYITPFDKQIQRHFNNVDDLTRTEIVESFMLALDSIAEEITLLSDGKISCRVEQEESSSYIILHGHLKWDVDNLDPKVYAIVIELLKDGFTYMADSKTFVITSRVKK